MANWLGKLSMDAFACLDLERSCRGDVAVPTLALIGDAEIGEDAAGGMLRTCCTAAGPLLSPPGPTSLACVGAAFSFGFCSARGGGDVIPLSL